MKPNYGQIFLLGFGFFGVSVIWSIYNAFVPIFLANRFHLAPGIVGFFMTLDNIAALLIQPVVGAWSDKLRTPIGRRLPFVLVGAPLGALAFGLIPLASLLPLFLACTSTLLLSMALWRTPIVALMPDLTPSPYRSQANGIINLMGGVGGIFAYFGGAALYKTNPAYPFWMGSGLVIFAMGLLLAFIREPKSHEAGEVEIQESQPNLLESLLLVLQDQNKSTLFLLLALFFFMVGYSAIEGFFTLYTVRHLGLNPADGTRLLGQMSLVFVIFALPSGYLGSQVGRRATIIAGLIFIGSLMLTMFLLPPATLITPLFKLPILGVVPVLGALLMLSGIAWALVIIHALPMVVDTTTDARVGTYTGLYYLFTTLAAILGPNLNGWIVQFNGGNYNTVMLFAAICMAIACGLMLGVRRGEAAEVLAQV